MAKERTYISFDWALKKLLRQKANFDILEGFLSVLLKEDIKIKGIIDPEANKDEAILKINRIDILVEDEQQRLMAIELQYNREIDYFYRMLFATSKASIDHIEKGYDYSAIKKVYSINLLYFELGQGKDYVYHGKNEFTGIHVGDTLQLSKPQKEKFLYDEVYEIYPEYYVIKINSFNDVAKDSLDEWIYFFKYSKVPPNFKAKGLKEVQAKMKIEGLSAAEKKAYEQHQLNLISERNVIETAMMEGEQIGFKKADKKIKQAEDKAKQAENKAKQAEDKAKQTLVNSILAMVQNTNLSNQEIVAILGTTVEQVQKIRKESKK